MPTFLGFSGLTIERVFVYAEGVPIVRSAPARETWSRACTHFHRKRFAGNSLRMNQTSRLATTPVLPPGALPI